METEELTELLDDDLEMWAQGGTRILPKSQLERPTQQSYPPVAYATAPSVPPPPATSSHASLWAAVIGMAAVFFLASVGGGIFYAMHRAAAVASSTASTSTTETTTVTTIATPEPEHVTLSTTSAPVVVVAPTPTVTATQKTAAITPPPAVVRYGTLQTFAAANGRPVFVDGKQVGVGGSRIKAVCGRHSVVVGTAKARMYDIPCSSTPLTVGTPD